MQPSYHYLYVFSNGLLVLFINFSVRSKHFMHWVLPCHCLVFKNQVSHVGFLFIITFFARNRRARVDIAMGINPRITHTGLMISVALYQSAVL